MEQIESEIRRVMQDHHKISAGVRSEEAKIDALSKEISFLEGGLGDPDMGDLERQRMQNLLSYQSTLIARAASRTELLRALHDDLLLLFLRRKRLRQADYVAALGIDMLPNLSPSSGLSIGNDNNDVIQNDCSMPTPLDIMTMSDGQDNLQELTTEQVQLPLGLKMPEINMNEGACLTPEYNGEYSDIQYKNNIPDDITMSILDTDANGVSIFKEMIDNSDFPLAETQNSRKMLPKMGRMAYHSLGRRLSVDFDEFGNPTGPNAGAFKRSINSYVCHFLPVRFKQIGDVPAEDYKAVLNVLRERYNFDPNKSYTRKKISCCYRQHKYKLLVQVKKDLERGIEPQKPSHVKTEDWDAFVVKTKDEEFDRISKKNKVSRSHQSVLSRKGLPGSLHKRKLKLSERDLMDDCIWGKVVRGSHQLWLTIMIIFWTTWNSALTKSWTMAVSVILIRAMEQNSPESAINILVLLICTNAGVHLNVLVRSKHGSTIGLLLLSLSKVFVSFQSNLRLDSSNLAVYVIYSSLSVFPFKVQGRPQHFLSEGK